MIFARGNRWFLQIFKTVVQSESYFDDLSAHTGDMLREKYAKNCGQISFSVRIVCICTCVSVSMCVYVGRAASRWLLWSHADNSVASWTSHLVSKVGGERQTGGHSEVWQTSGHSDVWQYDRL